MSVVVRVARPGDWDRVRSLLAGMGRIEEPGLRGRFESVAKSPDHCLLVAEVDGALVGYAWAQDRGEHLRAGWRSVRLHDLFVALQQRHRGHGRALFQAARTWAERRGARWMEWQASRDAVAFYDRLGLEGKECPDPEHPYYEIWFRGDPITDFARQRD